MLEEDLTSGIREIRRIEILNSLSALSIGTKDPLSMMELSWSSAILRRVSGRGNEVIDGTPTGSKKRMIIRRTKV